METIYGQHKICLLFHVEIRKNCYQIVVKGTVLVLLSQIEPHPTSWQYPLINHLGLVIVCPTLRYTPGCAVMGQKEEHNRDWNQFHLQSFLKKMGKMYLSFYFSQTEKTVKFSKFNMNIKSLFHGSLQMICLAKMKWLLG